MKILFLIGSAALAVACMATLPPSQKAASTDGHLPKSIYDFTMSNIDGHPVKLSEFKGKVLMIVNTASLCGNTPQYMKLEALYEKYKSKGLVIIGFPENDFMNQEPGTNQQIKEFCTTQYSITFPMFAKIDVKGPNESPLYKWLIEKSISPEKPIQWNFEKFIVNRSGNVVMRIDPSVQPDQADVVSMIERSLSAKP